MSQFGKLLDGRQERAILALLESDSISAAAEQTGVRRETLHRWLKDETFHQRYLDARREAADQAMAVMQRKCVQMAQMLIALAEQEDGPPHVRLQAAARVLDFGLGGVTVEGVREELAEIRQQIADLKERNR